MRLRATTLANAAAWGVIVLLIGAAVWIADRLGFAGLMILGGATWLVCVRAELNEDVPSWGVGVFRSRMDGGASPEQRAAMLDERRALLSPLRFYRWCGVALAIVGLAGFIWQQWQPASG